ncbi:MAG: hypothetical protein WC748_08630 [Legionellales bacterium]|jgi:hypothetical protein
MKSIRVSLRINKTEHEKILRNAKRGGFCLNQMMRDMINGKHCLCEEHALQHLVNNSDHLPHGWEDFLNDYKEQVPFLLKLSFENLMLLRLLVQQQFPDLIEQARQQRVKRFGLSEDTPKDS